MTIDYNSLLSAEEKTGIINQRLKQIANEVYQQEMNRRTCEAIGDEQGIEAIDKSLKALEAAYSVHKDELATLQGESTT